MTNRCIYCMSDLPENASVCLHCRRDQSVQSALYHLPIGTVLNNRYELGAVVLEDDFTLTYAAFDHYLQMPVYIEEFYPKYYAQRIGYEDENVSLSGVQDNRFSELGKQYVKIHQKAAATPKLTNTVQILDLIDANRTAYVVIPFQHAPTLREYIEQNGTMTLEQAIEFFRPLLKDLYILHKNDILITRLNPDAIRVELGTPVLTNFGIVASTRIADNKTLPSLFVKGYTAPEQIRSGQELSPAADVYAAAGLFYFVLKGSDPEDVLLRLFQDKKHFAQGLDELAGYEAARALLRAMKLDPAKRTQSVDAFLADLLNLEADESTGITRTQPVKKIEAKKTKSRAKSRKEKKSARMTMLCGAILVAAGIGLSIAAPYFHENSEYAQEISPGVYEDGKIDPYALEELQTDEISSLTFKDCDFSTLDLSALTSNPIITSISIENPENLDSLAFLEYFPNLQSLSMPKCGITDAMISKIDLDSLRFMTQMDISDNAISNISFVASMEKMEIFNAGNNQITSMEPLSQLLYLQEVDLRGNFIESFVPLSTYSDVILLLSGNQISSIEESDSITFYTLLSLYDNPLFTNTEADYDALDDLSGSQLIVSYAYDEEQLDISGTDWPLYILTYDNFAETIFVDADEESQNMVASYFASKPYSFKTAQEAQTLITNLIKTSS